MATSVAPVKRNGSVLKCSCPGQRSRRGSTPVPGTKRALQRLALSELVKLFKYILLKLLAWGY